MRASTSTPKVSTAPKTSTPKPSTPKIHTKNKTTDHSTPPIVVYHGSEQYRPDNTEVLSPIDAGGVLVLAIIIGIALAVLATFARRMFGR